MQKSGLKNFVYKVLIPCCLVVLIYYILNKFNFHQNNNIKQIQVVRSSVTVTPKINWLIGWSDHPAKRKIIEEFAGEYDFLNQNIKINIKFSENIDKTKHAREIVNMIQKNIYDNDIVWIDETVYFLVSQYLMNPDWGDEYLVNFQNIEGFLLTQRAEILKNPLVYKKTGSILTGPFLDGFYGVIWYNKQVANALNIEIKDRGMNFHDLIKYTQKVYEFNNLNKENVALFSESRNWFTISMLFQHLVWSEIEKMKLISPPPMDTALMIIQKIFKDFETLAKYDPLIDAHNVNMWYDAKKAFLNNKTLFMIGKTSLFNELYEIDSIRASNILPAELPSYDYNIGYIGSFQPTFAVFKSAPNRDAAIELIKNISTPYYANKWIKQTKNPTGIVVNIKENYLEDDPYNKFLVYIAKKYQYNVRYSIDTRYILGQNNTNMDNVIDNNLRMVFSNQITTEEALNNINSNLTE